MPKYNPYACCGSHCQYYSCCKKSEPCWGDVVVVDEECCELEDGSWDCEWIHACEGHYDIIVLGGDYVPDPEIEEITENLKGYLEGDV